VPARNPVLLAKELATIDLISGGRLFPAFGIGIALPSELAALGIPRDERVARLEETIEIIRALWTGEPVSYHGRFSTLDGVTLTPRPTRAKIEPWLGGSTPPAVKRIGRIADGWLASSVDPSRFATLLAILKVEAASAGRTVPEDHFGTIVFVAESDDQADALMAARQRAGRPTARGTIAVGVEQTRALLERFRDAGATKFVFYPLPNDPRPLLRALKTEVVDPFEAEPVYA
jgi:probable F420-dependent oxidoreductase